MNSKVREAAERLKTLLRTRYPYSPKWTVPLHRATRALLAALDEEEKIHTPEIVSVRFRHSDGSESLIPARTFTREQAIALGIPIHPDAVAVKLYGATIATRPEPAAPEEARE